MTRLTGPELGAIIAVASAGAAFLGLAAGTVWREAFKAKQQYHRDIVTGLVEKRLSLHWSPEFQEWQVYDSSPTTYTPLSANKRWQFAVLDALGKERAA